MGEEAWELRDARLERGRSGRALNRGDFGLEGRDQIRQLGRVPNRRQAGNLGDRNSRAGECSADPNLRR